MGDGLSITGVKQMQIGGGYRVNDSSLVAA